MTTIIVVDDDEDARFFLERSILRVFPAARVIAVSSAAAALDELQRGTAVDAIVTDNQLHETSGCEFIGELRRRGYTCPVVMVTCSRDPEVARKAYQAGARKVFEAEGDHFAEFLKLTLTAPGAHLNADPVEPGEFGTVS